MGCNMANNVILCIECIECLNFMAFFFLRKHSLIYLLKAHKIIQINSTN